MASFSQRIGNVLAKFLTKPLPAYEQFSSLSAQQMRNHLEPGDLILIEGNSRISTAIKYLTQSTWSHVCIFVGEEGGFDPLLEADLVEGVVLVPLSKYEGFNMRICRPVNLTEEDRKTMLNYLRARIGHVYDKKNIVDLMRYLIPTPPIPAKYRRKLIAFGSGDPTKAICSTLVAQGFQQIKYPILPRANEICFGDKETPEEDVILESRHYSHFTPRDFDLSPYFKIVKPTIESSFDYKKLKWQA